MSARAEFIWLYFRSQRKADTESENKDEIPGMGKRDRERQKDTILSSVCAT